MTGYGERVECPISNETSSLTSRESDVCACLPEQFVRGRHAEAARAALGERFKEVESLIMAQIERWRHA